MRPFEALSSSGSRLAHRARLVSVLEQIAYGIGQRDVIGWRDAGSGLSVDHRVDGTAHVPSDYGQASGRGFEVNNPKPPASATSRREPTGQHEDGRAVEQLVPPLVRNDSRELDAAVELASRHQRLDPGSQRSVADQDPLDVTDAGADERECPDNHVVALVRLLDPGDGDKSRVADSC